MQRQAIATPFSIHPTPHVASIRKRTISRRFSSFHALIPSVRARRPRAPASDLSSQTSSVWRKAHVRMARRGSSYWRHARRITTVYHGFGERRTHHFGLQISGAVLFSVILCTVAYCIYVARKSPKEKSPHGGIVNEGPARRCFHAAVAALVSNRSNRFWRPHRTTSRLDC